MAVYAWMYSIRIISIFFFFFFSAFLLHSFTLGWFTPIFNFISNGWCAFGFFRSADKFELRKVEICVNMEIVATENGNGVWVKRVNRDRTFVMGDIILLISNSRLSKCSANALVPRRVFCAAVIQWRLYVCAIVAILLKTIASTQWKQTYAYNTGYMRLYLNWTFWKHKMSYCSRLIWMELSAFVVQLRILFIQWCVDIFAQQRVVGCCLQLAAANMYYFRNYSSHSAFHSTYRSFLLSHCRLVLEVFSIQMKIRCCAPIPFDETKPNAVCCSYSHAHCTSFVVSSFCMSSFGN